MSEKGTNLAETIVAIIIGIIGGIILAAILAALFTKKCRCPSCNGIVQAGATICPHCGTEMRWD